MLAGGLGWRAITGPGKCYWLATGRRTHIAEGAQHRRVAGEEWLSHVGHHSLHPLRGVGLAFLNQHISHQAIGCRTLALLRKQSLPFKAGLVQNRRKLVDLNQVHHGQVDHDHPSPGGVRRNQFPLGSRNSAGTSRFQGFSESIG